MKFSPFILSVLLPAVALAAVDCLNEDSEADIADLLALKPLSAKRAGCARVTEIPAYVHVLVAKPLPANSTYREQVAAKMQTLNNNFKPWKYQFKLAGVDATVNASWAAGIDNEKVAKVKALRKGGYDTLNIFLVEGGKSGVCSLPAGGTNPVSRTTLDADACLVPLGLSTTSATITHEVGHWMGLLHTFQGGCNGTGDGCDDTLPQDLPSYGKLATPGDLNSCPAKEVCSGRGRQNVNNYMDYSDCAHEFTKCQGGRMEAAFTQRRKGRAVAQA
jgi:hypothetical protein